MAWDVHLVWDVECDGGATFHFINADAAEAKYDALGLKVRRWWQKATETEREAGTPPELAEEGGVALCAWFDASCIGWEGLNWQGKPLVYTRENVRKLESTVKARAMYAFLEHRGELAEGKAEPAEQPTDSTLPESPLPAGDTPSP